MKALKIAGLAVAGIVVVAAVLLVVGVPVGFMTSTVVQRVAHEAGYRLIVKGSTKASLWPSPNVTMSDVTLEPPNDGDAGARVSIHGIQADMTLASLWSGRPEITELAINRPEVSIPLHRERRVTKVNSTTPDASPGTATPAVAAIKHIVVTGGTITLFNTHDHVEDHIEDINAQTTIDADRHLVLDGHASAGGRPLTFNVKASLGDPSQPRQAIPAELSLDAPGLLQARLSSKADVRLNGTTVMINGLSGAIGDGAFDGWASIDFASKPLVKLDLDFRKLDIATTPPQTRPDSAASAWSTDDIALNGLNYVDAQVRLSAGELNIGTAHFAPAALEASLTRGLFKGTLSNVGAYGGEVNGAIDADVSPDTPIYTIHSELKGVRALPLLTSTAGFDKLDGKLQATIDVRSSGQSQQAIMSNLAGTVVANFQDGAIKGLNVAQMIRSLTSGTLSGWQQGRELSTDLSELSASFRLEKGKATTNDLNLIGPLVKMTGSGTVDLGARTLALRVEPKLVMTTQGQGRENQGRASDAVGFGIPVAIDGPWDAPRIYPDIAGILDNPSAAYAKLKQLGAGLFAPGEPGSGNSDNSGQSDSLGRLGQALGNLIRQGLANGQGRNDQPSSSPNPPPPNGPASPDQSNPQINQMLKQLFGR